jgi:hypothetical protein
MTTSIDVEPIPGPLHPPVLTERPHSAPPPRDEPVVIPMTEGEWAAVLERRGQRVVTHNGRHWLEVARGFYEPVHWLAALTGDEATRPRRACWGFRARLAPAEEGQANGTMPVQLCSNVADYTEESLARRRRNDLRRSRGRVRIIRVTDPALLHAQGLAVIASAQRRTSWDSVPSAQQYAVSVESLVSDPHQLVLAGMVGEQLAGYLHGYAVDDVAYVDRVYLATEFLPTCIGTALPFEFVQACRRAPGVRHVVYGLHSIEDPRLCAFKAGMGFPPASLPTRVSLPPGMATFLRHRFPYKLYRLTGRLSPVMAPDATSPTAASSPAIGS